MGRSIMDGVPLSSQIIWFENRVKTLEERVDRLSEIISDLILDIEIIDDVGTDIADMDAIRSSLAKAREEVGQ